MKTFVAGTIIINLGTEIILTSTTKDLNIKEMISTMILLNIEE